MVHDDLSKYKYFLFWKENMDLKKLHFAYILKSFTDINVTYFLVHNFKTAALHHSPMDIYSEVSLNAYSEMCAGLRP